MKFDRMEIIGIKDEDRRRRTVEKIDSTSSLAFTAFVGGEIDQMSCLLNCQPFYKGLQYINFKRHIFFYTSK